VKLSSTGRIRLVSLATAILLTSGIGSFLAIGSYRADILAIDTSISQTIANAASENSQELSAALFHIDEKSLDLSLYLISRDGSQTTVNESTKLINHTFTYDEASNAVRSIRSFDDGSNIRYQSLLISGGDYLLIASSSQSVENNLSSNLISVALLTLITSLATFFLISLYLKRLKRRDEADALARMQAFLGDASHELRTPLTIIKGYVEMLSTGQLKESADQDRAFKRVNTEIVRMETLIHDLLLLAELGESGQRESAIVDLSELVAAHAEDFKTLNSSRKVDISIEGEIEIVGVRDFISRFIQNALNNIARHTESDAPVSLTLKRNGKVATLVIEDGGKGLPESAYSNEVRSLTRFDPSRSRESGGSGLGMSIMAAVIERIGGKLRLEKSHLGGLAVIAEIPTYRE
jgi:two-component system OmpR family sensor kinase